MAGCACDKSYPKKLTAPNASVFGAAAVLVLIVAAPASAQDMVYQPINPTFGGNPFNSAHLLGLANAQNKERDPATKATNSQAD